MARMIRETPVLFGNDAARFDKEMKRVEGMTSEERKANREKLLHETEAVKTEWILTFKGFRGW